MVKGHRFYVTIERDLESGITPKHYHSTDLLSIKDKSQSN
jgi:hypothetical protein